MLSAPQIDFLRGRHLAVLATVDEDGAAHAIPMWYAVDGSDLVMTTARGSPKHRNLARTGRATVVVDQRERPYRALMMRCAAAVSDDGVALKRSKIAARYLGEPHLSTHLAARPSSDYVLVRLTPLSVTEHVGAAP